MRRQLVAPVAALAALWLLSAAPVRAISNGEPDFDHPNVGALGVKFGDSRFIVCSGTLIAPNVFLVAAHCIAGLQAEHVFVTLDVDIFAPYTTIEASELHYDPAFLHINLGDSHDLGVVILSEDVTDWQGVHVTPAQLAPAGLLDELAMRGGLRATSFVNVGYGFSSTFQGGPPRFEIDGVRNASTSPFKGLTLTLLKQLMNTSATGEGGVCFIDSGGPKFLPGTNTIVAVEKGGDAVCRAESVAYRLDIPQARAFLGQFVTLP